MIKILNLKKIYSNNILALNNISLNINNGDFFAILGRNGAGKSTIIGILTSLIKKNSGKIFISGYDLDINNIEIKRLIGFVPQEYNFNQFENVLDIVLNQAGFYGIKRSNSTKLANFYLKFFDLWDKRKFISMNLSSGMKRRLMFVKSLIHDPKILILDEPTSGVDIISRKLIWNFLTEFNKKGNTILLTTHYLDEVEQLCNKVAIIDLGKILINMNVSDLLLHMKKKNIILNVENNNIKNTLLFKSFKMLSKNKNIIEVFYLKKSNLNFLFKYLIKKGIIINNIKDKQNNLEELFIDLIKN